MKISKTEKRRQKKEAEEKAKQERIKAALKESEEKFLRGELSPKMVEQNSIQECSRTPFSPTQNRARGIILGPFEVKYSQAVELTPK